MNIAHVVLSLECGGLEQLVIQLVHRLKEQGHNAFIICLENKGELIPVAEKRGIRVIKMEGRIGFHLIGVLKLASILRKEKVGVVHTHNFAPLFYGSLAARLAAVPCLNTRHGRAERRAPRWVWNLNEFVVSVSQDARDQMLKFNMISPKKVKTIFNGIEPSRFISSSSKQLKNEILVQLNLKPGSFIIGHVGRLAQEKDQSTLIRVLPELIQEGLDVSLVIVGDGPMKAHLQRITRQYKLDARVYFLGYQENIPALVSIFDVFVLCSVMEGISLTLLEAMAAGKPTIVSNVGGNPEVVKDGETGFLFQVGYPEHIAAAVRTLYKNRELARRMGKNGFKRVQNFFNLEKMTREYDELYDQMKKS